MRELVHRSALAPVETALPGDGHRGRRPARRSATGNTLLKAIEEPTPKTVWLLCAPTIEDVLPTIRSRCRNVVAGDADRAGGDPLPGRAARRRRVGRGVRGPGQPGPHRPGPRAGLGREDPQPAPRGGRPAGRAHLAGGLHERRGQPRRHRQGRDRGAHRAEQRPRTSSDLEALYGDDRKAKTSRAYRASLRDAPAQPEAAREAPDHGRHRPRADGRACRSTATRSSLQTGARRRPGQRGGPRPRSLDLARRSTAEENIRRIDAIFTAREQMMEFNTTPLLALESMMVVPCGSGSRPPTVVA